MTQEFWYLSRAAGFTAYGLLFVSVALGIVMGTRLVERFVPRNAIFDLHRFTTILALLFTFFHVFVLLLDGYFNFTVWQLTVPFLSPYRRWQTAVGVFALYTLVLLVCSFYVRRFIGYRAWRSLHFLTFALFAGATLHGITAGTDTTESWAKLLYVGVAAATLGLIIYRVQYRIPDTSTMRTVRLTAGVATVIAAALLLFATGLFTTTRARLSEAQVSTSQSGGNATHPFLPNFDADFSGTYTQTGDATAASLVIDGSIAGDLASRVHVELVQKTSVPTPDDESIERTPDDEQVEARPVTTVTTNTAELRDPDTNVAFCTGSLTTLRGGQLAATCDGGGPYSGIRIVFQSQLSTSSDGTLAGSLSGTMRRLS